MDQRSGKRRAVLGRSRRRSRVVFAVIVSAAVLLTIPVFAWLYRQRSMETVTKVNMPYALFIGAGDAKPVQQLELSNIDVSGEQKSKDVVFCVYSKKPGTRYYLQLAHTTNIGFRYEIETAELSDSGEISYLGKQYRRGAALTGSYLNRGSMGMQQSSIIRKHTGSITRSRKRQSLCTGKPLMRRYFRKHRRMQSFISTIIFYISHGMSQFRIIRKPI